MPAIQDLPAPAQPLAPSALFAAVEDPSGAATTVRVSGEQLLALVYPVGCLYFSKFDTNPAAIFGFGTWALVGQGRVVVGVDPADPDFDAADKSGGEKGVTLTAAQSGVPAHSHPVNDPGHNHLTQRYPTATGSSSGFTIDTSMSGTPAINTLPTAGAATGLTVGNATPADAAESHQNMPPYLTRYVWERTA